MLSIVAHIKKPAVCKIILSALLKNCFICNFLLYVASSSFWHCFGGKIRSYKKELFII